MSNSVRKACLRIFSLRIARSDAMKDTLKTKLEDDVCKGVLLTLMELESTVRLCALKTISKTS